MSASFDQLASLRLVEWAATSSGCTRSSPSSAAARGRGAAPASVCPASRSKSRSRKSTNATKMIAPTLWTTAAIANMSLQSLRVAPSSRPVRMPAPTPGSDANEFETASRTCGRGVCVAGGEGGSEVQQGGPPKLTRRLHGGYMAVTWRCSREACPHRAVMIASGGGGDAGTSEWCSYEPASGAATGPRKTPSSPRSTRTRRRRQRS